LPKERILPAAADRGVAVLVNMPFEKARLFKVVEGHPLPDFAKEIGASNWAQFFLKWVISHPAVTCAIPATTNPDHESENIGALQGPLPDKEMRARMVSAHGNDFRVSTARRHDAVPRQDIQRRHPAGANPAAPRGQMRGAVRADRPRRRDGSVGP